MACSSLPPGTCLLPIPVTSPAQRGRSPSQRREGALPACIAAAGTEQPALSRPLPRPTSPRGRGDLLKPAAWNLPPAIPVTSPAERGRSPSQRREGALLRPKPSRELYARRRQRSNPMNGSPVKIKAKTGGSGTDATVADRVIDVALASSLSFAIVTRPVVGEVKER